MVNSSLITNQTHDFLYGKPYYTHCARIFHYHLLHYLNFNKFMRMMMIVINCFRIMVDWWKALSLTHSQNHCQKFSPLQTSDKLQAGLEPGQNLNLGFVKWNCAIVITTTPQHHKDRLWRPHWTTIETELYLKIVKDNGINRFHRIGNYLFMLYTFEKKINPKLIQDYQRHNLLLIEKLKNKSKTKPGKMVSFVETTGFQ